jgi:hypothetical protein
MPQGIIEEETSNFNRRHSTKSVKESRAQAKNEISDTDTDNDESL